MTYTIEQIEQIAATLRALPPIERKQRQVNKHEAVALLAKEIKALQQRGYTLEQIADALRGTGFDITTPALKNYLQRAKGPKKKAAPPAREAVPPGPPAVVERHSGLTPRPDSDDL